MDILNLITTLISGAVGGNIAGPATQDKNLGVLANTISGLIGGTAATYILQALGIITAVTSGSGQFDWSSLLANIGASGGSGAVLTAIITYIKSAMDAKK